MHAILEKIDVHVHCGECGGSYDVPASLVAESQRLMDEGCPGSSYECAPSFYATLLAPEALQALTDAWHEVERSAGGRADGAGLSGHLRVELALSRDDTAQALARWADDGGRT